MRPVRFGRCGPSGLSFSAGLQACLSKRASVGLECRPGVYSESMRVSLRPPVERLGFVGQLVVAVVVLALAAAPFGHHDLVCHLKSTTHCTACTVGSAAEPAADQGVVSRLWLHDAGAALVLNSEAPVSAPLRHTSKRAPPAIG